MQCSLCHRVAVHRCREACGFIACDHCKERPHTHGTTSANRVLFDEFFRENVGAKLVTTQSYQIDFDQLNTWVAEVETSNSPPEIAAFAGTFAQHLTHITFYQFRAKLNEAAHELRHKVEILRPRRTYLIVGRDYRASETWVALLCWSVLRSIVTDVVIDATQITDWERTVAIYVDDVSYSGGAISDELEQLATDLTMNSRCFVLVPYLSDAARDRIKAISPSVKLLHSTNALKTLSQCLELDGRDSEKILAVLRQPPWLNAYKVRGTHSLVYFDHKFTDPIAAPLVSDLPVVETDGRIVETFRIINDDQENRPRAVAFYKTIPYTFRGSRLKSEGDLFIALDSIVTKGKSKLYSM
jgi:hypothetical protein